MCLIKDHRFPKRAKEDIECWKELCWKRVIDGDDVEYYTPVMDERIRKFPSTIRSTLPAIFGVLENTIGPAGVHVYKERPEPQWGNRAIVRCIIPKGTLYYEGGWGHEIAAGKIKLLEVIEMSFVPRKNVRDENKKICYKKKKSRRHLKKLKRKR